MNIRFIKSSEKKEIIEKLEEQFGISDLPYLLIETGKEKIRAFSGSLSKDQISMLSDMLNIESIGLYIIKKEKNNQLRLSFDAAHLLKNQINKNIAEINEEQLQLWIRGHSLTLKYPTGIHIISYKQNFLGCGKSDGENMINHVPKERRLKVRTL